MSSVCPMNSRLEEHHHESDDRVDQPELAIRFERHPAHEHQHEQELDAVAKQLDAGGPGHGQAGLLCERRRHRTPPLTVGVPGSLRRSSMFTSTSNRYQNACST